MAIGKKYTLQETQLFIVRFRMKLRNIMKEEYWDRWKLSIVFTDEVKAERWIADKGMLNSALWQYEIKTVRGWK